MSSDECEVQHTQHAFLVARGQENWADYSGVSRTLSGLSWDEARQIAQVLEQIGQPYIAAELQLLRSQGKRIRYDGDLTDLPVIIPHTAAGIALLLVYGSRGWIGAPAEKLGLAFTNQPAGIVAAMLFVSAPYLVNLSREAFALVDRELELQALVEGASAWGAFWHVTLPIAWRGVVSGALMMWARGISEFGAVVIIAYHPRIVPVLVYERFTGFGLDEALPVTVILIGLALVVFSLLRGWLMRGEG